MDRKELEARTKRFAIAVIRFVSRLERTTSSRVIGYQLLKSATSIGANYREANRAQSRRDFAYKISLAEKEASETHYWLEICEELPLGKGDESTALLGEAGELLAIFTSIGRSVRSRDHDDKKRSGVTERGFRGYAANDFGDEESDFVVPEVLSINE